MAGLILILAALVEFVVHDRVFDRMKKSGRGALFALLWKKGAWMLLMPLGTLVYLFLNWHITGDPFRFLSYQERYWHTEFTYFGVAIRDQFTNIVYYGRTLARSTFVPNILAFSLAMAMLVYASAKRQSAAHIVYLLGYTAASFALSWLLSGGRYMTAAVPLFLFLAHAVERRPLLRVLVPAAFLLGLLVMTRWYVLGGPVF
jgi:hypothetical protein